MHLKDTYIHRVHTLAAIVLSKVACAKGFIAPEIGGNPVLLRHSGQVQDLASAIPEGVVFSEAFAKKCGFQDAVPHGTSGLVLVKYPAETLVSEAAAMAWARNLVMTMAPHLVAYEDDDEPNADQKEGQDDANTNVLITYMYRDQSNYKAHGEAVVAGPVPNVDMLSLLYLAGDREDHEYIIPGQIGLPDLQNEFNGGEAQWDDDRDHPWHELQDVTLTAQSPTVDITWAQLQEKLVDLLVGQEKWNENHRPADYEAMCERYREAHALN